MSRRLPLALLVLGVVLSGGASTASALPTHRCRLSPTFRCATLTVPLDRSGSVPGRVRLAVAVERPRRGADGFLVALTGGPGQSAVDGAYGTRSALAPALRHRRLVVFDQRGTGRSGALRCAALQRLGVLDPVNTRVVERCARTLGRAQAFYGTTDTVLDLESIRRALGADRLEVMGVSYGTYVAQQYARRFPERIAGLILDSVVEPDGLDPYFLDTFARLRRVLGEQCARGRCATATGHPLADLARVIGRLRRGPLRGVTHDARGRAHPTALAGEPELLLTIMEGDLNPYLQASLPGAIAAAAHGDPALLLRLRGLAEGPASPATEFSALLNSATTCLDAALPYALTEPYGDRLARWRHGIDGVPDAVFAPFSRAGVLETSVAHDCLRWPAPDRPAVPAAGPLPDVPTLLLAGRLDTRTPVENARAVAALLPRAQLLTVPGTGHDVLDADITGCAALALRRFAAGLQIGRPCAGLTNAVRVRRRPPRSLRAYRALRGRERVVRATLDTVQDAETAALQALYEGFRRLTGGGLHGGDFSAGQAGEPVTLRRYALVPGVAVSGTVHVWGGAVRGTLLVDGPGRLDGVLRLEHHGVVAGVLGGRAIRSSVTQLRRG